MGKSGFIFKKQMATRLKETTKRRNRTNRKSIFTKLALKKYLDDKDIQVRIGAEAYSEIERKLNDFLVVLVTKSIHVKEERKGGTLTGQDVNIASELVLE